MTKTLTTTLVGFLVTLPDAAWASGVLQFVKLEQVVRESDVIVVVEGKKPYLSMKKIPIQLKGRASVGRKRQAYTQIVHHFSVKAVLKKPAGVKLGRVIHVANAGWRWKLKMAGAHYSGHANPIVVYRQYRSSLPNLTLLRTRGKRAIVFLRRDKNGQFEFTLDGGYESFKRKPSVVRLVAKQRPSSSRPPPRWTPWPTWP